MRATILILLFVLFIKSGLYAQEPIGIYSFKLFDKTSTEITDINKNYKFRSFCKDGHPKDLSDTIEYKRVTNREGNPIGNYHSWSITQYRRDYVWIQIKNIEKFETMNIFLHTANLDIASGDASNLPADYELRSLQLESI